MRTPSVEDPVFGELTLDAGGWRGQTQWSEGSNPVDVAIETRDPPGDNVRRTFLSFKQRYPSLVPQSSTRSTSCGALNRLRLGMVMPVRGRPKNYSERSLSPESRSATTVLNCSSSLLRRVPSQGCLRSRLKEILFSRLRSTIERLVGHGQLLTWNFSTTIARKQSRSRANADGILPLRCCSDRNTDTANGSHDMQLLHMSPAWSPLVVLLRCDSPCSGPP